MSHCAFGALPKKVRALIIVGLLLVGCVQLLRGLYIPAKAVVAQYLLERAWRNTQVTHAAHRPWPWADMVPVAKLEVPRLGEHAIVLEGASGQALAFGPAHLSNTPAIGARGTAVIAAHRDTHFSMLAHLKQSDQVTVTTHDGIKYIYVVRAFRVVNANDSGVSAHAAGPSGSSLALVTCYPFNAVKRGALRYVVFADRVSAQGERML